MKLFVSMCCLLCFFTWRIQGMPQITKLFPVQELIAYHKQINSQGKPIDTFLGKLRATYNFVFRKPENTTNVEHIFSIQNSTNPDAEIFDTSLLKNQEKKKIVIESRVLSSKQNDLIDYAEPLGSSEMQEELISGNKNNGYEMIPKNMTIEWPIYLQNQLIEWLGSLLGSTYAIYAKLTKVVSSN